jgi:DNA-binding MurR/RpiR family transcriptional regulator
MKSVEEVIDVLKRRHPTMSAKHKLIAAHIISQPEDIAVSSTQEIAQSLEINPATLVRFAQSLSFSGFSELKKVFKQQVKNSKTGYTQKAQHLAAHAGKKDISPLFTELISAQRENLDAVFEKTPLNLLMKVADQLITAKNVYIIGLRSCFSSAHTLHYNCQLIRKNVHISHGIGGTLVDRVRNISKDDVLVSISTKPYSNQTILITEFAKDCGATIVSLTDSELSPLLLHADYKLLFNSEGPAILGSVVSQTALIEAITTLMIVQGGEDTLEMLKRSDALLTHLDVYSD